MRVEGVKVLVYRYKRLEAFVLQNSIEDLRDWLHQPSIWVFLDKEPMILLWNTSRFPSRPSLISVMINDLECLTTQSDLWCCFYEDLPECFRKNDERLVYRSFRRVWSIEQDWSLRHRNRHERVKRDTLVAVIWTSWIMIMLLIMAHKWVNPVW